MADQQLPEYRTYTRRELVDEVIDTVANNVRCKLDPHSFDETSDVVNDMHADSLDLVGIILDLEEKLCVTLTDDEASDKYKVRDIVDVFYNRLKLEGRIKE